MNLLSVRTALGTVIAAGTDLRAYDAAPGAVTPPCFVVYLAQGEYDADFDDAVTATWRVLVLVSRADDVRGQYALDAYLAPNGAGSVHKAIADDPTLSGAVETCRVTGWDEPSAFEIGGVDYLGVGIDVEAIG